MQATVLKTTSDDAISTEQEQNYMEHGISKIMEQQLERYFAQHSKGEIPPGLYDRVINEIEKIIFNVTMKHVNGNQVKASKILGINRNTLRKRMLKFTEQK